MLLITKVSYQIPYRVLKEYRSVPLEKNEQKEADSVKARTSYLGSLNVFILI